MLVMKFGGTSMGSALRMRSSAQIIADRSVNGRTAVVVSAVGGISNRLQDSISSTCADTDVQTVVDIIRKLHSDIINELASVIPAYTVDAVETSLYPLYAEYLQLLSAIAAFGECPPSVEARIMGLGERLSVPIFAELLRSQGLTVQVLDSREYIVTEGSLLEGEPVYEKIDERMQSLRNARAPLLLAPGFIAGDISGKAAILGRNGSDFSAALYAMGLKADRLEIWSDVDGIYTADPRIVSDAILVHEMSYEEAMELSFFGSKVLHPKTLIPVANRRIETWSLNSFNSSARGTRIAARDSLTTIEGTGPVRGITCLRNTSLVSVSGAGLKGRKGAAARVFGAVSHCGSSVLLITQSGSEYTISFCVRSAECRVVRAALATEFAHEIRDGIVDEISVTDDVGIVSIVGDGMMHTPGVAGTFFSALAFGGINIRAIAQGSSERSISTVIDATDADKAVRIAHRFFFKTMQSIEVILAGVGVVGSKLLEQIRVQQTELYKSSIDLKIIGIMNSCCILLNRQGISLDSWQEKLDAEGQRAGLDLALDFIRAEKPLNPVFVDCTATEDIPTRYPEILLNGMHIVTPNKRANSRSMEFYHQLRRTAVAGHKRFLYETNVGAGLPVIDTFKSMLSSGDSLIHFSGILSGSLSYIFGRLDDGIPFSQAVGEARERGYTEPDPRDDLSGMDVARKALIIAREAGCSVELDDVRIDSVFPKGFNTDGSVSDFMDRLTEADSWFAERTASLAGAGKVLRFAAHVTGKAGGHSTISDGCHGIVCRVGLVEVAASDPLAAIRGGENAFVFTTRYYSPIPLVIRGYGAGADVTASGIFADLLRTASW